MKLMSFLAWIWKYKLPILIGGVFTCAMMIAYVAYVDSYTYEMRVSYIYPGAENGVYPDGKRFLPEDLTEIDRIEEALGKMQDKGWYEFDTVEQISKNLSVKALLTDPVQKKVEYLRSEGEEYTYYNNEYLLSFRQPNPFLSKNDDFYIGLFRENRSKEFMEELFKSNLYAFLSEHTEGAVFSDFSSYLTAEDMDYDRLAQMYQSKAELNINYLRKKQLKDSTFVAQSTGRSFNDLMIGYQSLVDVEISRLDKYVNAVKISNQIDERVNRYKVSIEESDIEKKKKSDEFLISQAAMMEYDHTFSENIIIVSVNEENGLYQARPKTAYDTVTQKALDAGVASDVAQNSIAHNQQQIQDYVITMSNSGSAKGMLNTADGMSNDIVKKYDELAKQSAATISEYINTSNMQYMKAIDAEKKYFTITNLILWGMAFIGGATISALIILASQFKNRIKNESKGEIG